MSSKQERGEGNLHGAEMHKKHKNKKGAQEEQVAVRE
jgi:hypothetical protein